MSSGFKLKLNTSILNRPSIASPSPTPGASPVPRLKLTSKSQPPTPGPSQDAEPVPKKTKAGRATKPSAKVVESRKRVKEEDDTGDEQDTIAVKAPPTKKVKLQFSSQSQKTTVPKPQSSNPKTPVTPAVVIKRKGKPPARGAGTGYDSDASDREIDPAIEEQFILRMMPGDDCEYLKQAIAERRIGTDRNIHMKFFDGEGRRAAITIRKNVYAATLVDLPTIIEGMKSWDKRGWWKSADICQMLLVFRRVDKEMDAKTAPLPAEVDPETFSFPHGLTPPMRFARERRFKKRIHKREIEKVEDELERLLRADALAESSTYKIFDPSAGERSSRALSMESTPDYGDGGEYDDQDAEGEVDESPGGYFNNNHHGELAQEEEEHDDLAAELEAQMAEMEAESNVADTPQAQAEEDSGDESDEDEEDEDVVEQLTEEEKARQAYVQAMRAEIQDIRDQITENEEELAKLTNKHLRTRLQEKARKLNQELQLKMSALGEGEENE